MAEFKTKLNDESVAKFLNSVTDDTQRKDSFTIAEMMQQATGLPPKMWGTVIFGFGSYHYKYESGHEGNMCIIGFSPRKQNFALNIGAGNKTFKNFCPILVNTKQAKVVCT